VDAGLEAALGSRTIDVYFDSVGGATLESALRRLSIGARIVICGAIGSYNAGTGDAAPGPRNYMQLLVRRATMSGFVVLDYAARYAEARARLAAWVAAGKVRAREDVTDGLTRAPDALLGLFKGTNRGKVVVRVASAGFRRGGTADTGERWSKL
jgi:NADPH-dependent curcumin reductase